ncbi:MAG: hypothetical protein Q9210_005302 [Variospora velana]
MDPIRSFFRRSRYQENLIRTVRGIQQSNTGRASTEEEMKTIIDGFPGYIRALEQEVQAEVEKALGEETNRVNEEIQSRLDASRKDLDTETAKANDQRKKNEELQSQIDSQASKIQHGEKHIAELQLRVDSQNRTQDANETEIGALQHRIDAYSKKVQSDEKHIAELQLRIDAQDRTINDKQAEIGALGYQLDELKSINAQQKRIIDSHGNRTGDRTEHAGRVIHVDLELRRVGGSVAQDDDHHVLREALAAMGHASDYLHAGTR